MTSHRRSASATRAALCGALALAEREACRFFRLQATID